jgi:putative addiction module killer protein
MQIFEYVDAARRRPFRSWFERLDRIAALKIDIALRRLEQGNVSNVKSVGGGIYEYRIDFGPGYRLYLAYDGQQIVILLGGGTKKRQGKDIASARARWADYERRKGTGGPQSWH